MRVLTLALSDIPPLPPVHVPAAYLHNMPGLHKHNLSHTVLQNRQSSGPTLPVHAESTSPYLPAPAARAEPQRLLQKRMPEPPPPAASNLYVRSDMPVYTHSDSHTDTDNGVLCPHHVRKSSTSVIKVSKSPHWYLPHLMLAQAPALPLHNTRPGTDPLFHNAL